jgi:hypothetical protein
VVANKDVSLPHNFTSLSVQKPPLLPDLELTTTGYKKPTVMWFSRNPKKQVEK